VTGLTGRHIAECFQRSNDTISKYFKKILKAFSHCDIYTKYLQLPHVGDPTPPEILNNTKFYPFLQHAVGAIDGTHIVCRPATNEQHASCNRK
ncbi:hypothetical protein PAXRUDRAFT_108329, partial [Paxillus rubicundulus Ve08.2h10]